MIPKILITPQAFELLEKQILETLGSSFEVKKTGGQIPDKNILITELSKVDGCIIGAERVDEEVLKECPKLKILSRFGSGHDSIESSSAKKYGVAVAIVPNETTSNAVARHAFAMLLCLTNNLLNQTETLSKGNWSKVFNLSPIYTKVGVVGFGRIGQRFAEMCDYHGFQINYFSRRNHLLDKYTWYNNIEKIVENSDIISIHLNLNNLTKGIFDKQLLKKLKNKILINTSRGGLVDEVALKSYLDDGTVLGAGLDVFVDEPIFGNSSLLASARNVICTSHIGAYDKHSIEKVGLNSLLNIKHFFSNEYDKINDFVVKKDL